MSLLLGTLCRFCLISLSFQELGYIVSMDHMQTLVELKSECYPQSQYLALHSNFLPKNLQTKMNRIQLKLKFLDNEMTITYFLNADQPTFNRDTQKLTNLEINQYGILTSINSLEENHYILKDRQVVDFDQEFVDLIFSKELFLECQSSDEGNFFSCEVK